jgi:uncharacterized protein
MHPIVRPLATAILLLTSVAVAAQAWGPLNFLGRDVPVGTKRKFSYQTTATFEGAFLDTVVFVARGRTAGPTLCVVAMIHGDERNGFEIARQVFAGADPQRLAGTLIALPAANVHGFRTGSRYMPDRRDLNRAFPGSPKGSNSALVAAIIFDALRSQCTAVIDLHTGSFDRANLPQVRVDLGDARALELARSFGAPVVLGGGGPQGSLRRELADAGVAAILYEAGLPLRFEPAEIATGVRGVRNILIKMGMSAGPAGPPTPSDRVFARSRWIRVPVGQGGVYYPGRQLGEEIRAGDVIARIAEPFTDQQYVVMAPVGGRIVGLAVPQVVFSGYALVHIAQP